MKKVLLFITLIPIVSCISMRLRPMPVSGSFDRCPVCSGYGHVRVIDTAGYRFSDVPARRNNLLQEWTAKLIAGGVRLLAPHSVYDITEESRSLPEKVNIYDTERAYSVYNRLGFHNYARCSKCNGIGWIARPVKPLFPLRELDTALLPPDRGINESVINEPGENFTLWSRRKKDHQ